MLKPQKVRSDYWFIVVKGSNNKSLTYKSVMKKINTNLKSVIWKTSLSYCVWKTLGKYWLIQYLETSRFSLHTYSKKGLLVLAQQWQHYHCKLPQHCLKTKRIQQVPFFTDALKRKGTDFQRHCRSAWLKHPNDWVNAELHSWFCLVASKNLKISLLSVQNTSGYCYCTIAL